MAFRRNEERKYLTSPLIYQCYFVDDFNHSISEKMNIDEGYRITFLMNLGNRRNFVYMRRIGC